MNNLIDKAVKICGSQTALANIVGVKQQYVWNWLNKNKSVPAEYVIPIEKATKGEITRHELRPDIYPSEEQKTA